MSELDKLTSKWQRDHSRRFTKHLGQYYTAVDKLQKECKHDKTHWIQELEKDGTVKDGLFKRCFVCGATLQKVETTEAVIELALKAFDVSVDNSLALNDNKATVEENKP